MTLRKRLERAARITLLVFILAAAAFLSAITTIRIAIRGRIVAMPDLIGKPAEEAQKMLAEKQLGLRVADRVYSSLPVNAVVRQSPAPGEQVKVSQNGHVILSLGPQTVTIPNLESRPVRLARVALLQAGLQPGEISNVYLPASAPAIVLEQDPPPGETATSPRVNLLVAAGPRPVWYVMPPVVGLEQREAERVLYSSGLRIAKRTYISQAGAPKGTVIGQKPPRGERIDGDAQVELGIAD